jgi:hypothetical protein
MRAHDALFELNPVPVTGAARNGLSNWDRDR